MGTSGDSGEISAARGKVMLVDHGTTVFHGLMSIVESLGYEVQTCASTVAVIVAGGYRPDVVLFDLGMPGPNTCDLLTRFRRDLPHIPIVIVGAEVDARTVEHFLNKEAFAYIAKPYTPEAIAGVLRAAISEG
jgi:two-component system C4-dicarboxylate transport response regulator DctD